MSCERNRKEVEKWYRLSAEQGHAQAQYNLGNKYDNGQGVPQDYKEAVKWYRLAAEQGLAEAQYIMGLMHDKGTGVPLEKAKEMARNWKPKK